MSEEEGVVIEEKQPSNLLIYWQENIKSNLKKISAVLGSMLVMVIGLTIYGFRTGLDIFTILMTVVFAINPFLTILINIMFKGESEIKDREISLLKQELDFKRELSEWQLQVAALRANKEWMKYNDLLREVNELEKEDKA